MKRTVLQHIIFLFSLVCICYCTPFYTCAQEEDAVQYVNPFIGTAKSNVYTKWGNEGGTYPGAVAPWGSVQLSPETRSSGYDYKDRSILFFSCLQHHSGYPGGSGGRLHIMPFTGNDDKDYKQLFHHDREKAQPGYYTVELADNIQIEATATTHAGMFQITFPGGVTPSLVITDAGDIEMTSNKEIRIKQFNAVLHFKKEIKDTQNIAGGCILHFPASQNGVTVIAVQLSASPVGFESAEQNIEAETANISFDDIRKNTKQEWEKELSVVSINDSSTDSKIIFYTALYHSLLLPNIISDVNGNYLGSDNKIYKTNGKHEYGGFSPWDTFRSLHPLLALLYPGRQNDMMLSMLDIYRQSGYLPVESMTGNHSIPILVDSYLKGIKPVDSSLLYQAMKKSIVDGPFLQNDMSLYQQDFIPYPHTESVTRTVEYAYDDWALAQYANHVMHDDSLSFILMKRSRNYQYLFNADELSLLPKKDSTFYYGTANAGYKEGDQWVYSLFLPQYQQDLINRMDGDENFIRQIDKEFADNRLVFDNETMFHVPYLFNSTAYPYKTQQWITSIRKRFSATPGGLPGNDDLGATSSWFVWSALGVYPVCPGNPVYAIGTPLFKEATLFLSNGKQLQIKANHLSATDFYIKQTELNGNIYNSKWLSHNDLLKGGRLLFDMSEFAGSSVKKEQMPGEADSASNIIISNDFVNRKTVFPDEPFWVHYTLNNKGGSGTAIVTLHINDSVFITKNNFVQHGETRQDSIQCKLYGDGKNTIRLNGLQPLVMQVLPSSKSVTFSISDLQVSPVVKRGNMMVSHYMVTNKGGEKNTFIITVKMNGKTVYRDKALLQPGGSVIISHQLKMNNDGLYHISVVNNTATTKVYSQATNALVLNFPTEIMDNKTVSDESGFANNGLQSSFGNYIELPHMPSLDSNGTTLTMMAWIYDTGTTKPYTELIAKGDNHVLQIADGRSLTFFAGGWGRGDCTVPLPADWKAHWHHIAGICNGKDLRLYIDGKLVGITPLEEMIDLDVSARWTIGSNEEFPLDRTFAGKIKGVKIYVAPLSAQDVLSIYNKEK